MRDKHCQHHLILTALLTAGLILLITDCKKDESTPEDTIQDIDGNVYHIVSIGTQTWMTENLRTSRYADGTSIPFVNSRYSWGVLSVTSKAYCYYGDDVNNAKPYGALYTWAAAMKGVASSVSNPSRVQGVCPAGWHLPSDDEWKELETYLGGSTIAGGKMKEAGTIHWNDPNGDAINESGFTALPGGTYNGDNKYYDMGSAGYYYSSTMNMVRIAGNDMLSFTYFQFRYNSLYAIKGYSTMGSPSHASVRCVKN
jgi:uncharacterized protein (TIGR02145 family)